MVSKNNVDRLWAEGSQPTSEQKRHRVDEVFSKVVPHYDLMNDLMTLGSHRLWKQFAVEMGAVRPAMTVLDLACGTMDIAMLVARRCRQAKIVAVDASEEMLIHGRARLFDEGLNDRIETACALAEKLPYDDNCFDRIFIGFGLRNFHDIDGAFKECLRVLKPTGKLIVLELSRPENRLVEAVYDGISDKVLPFLGEVIAKDRGSYRYLHDSIRNHPRQSDLLSRMRRAGFHQCDYKNLALGVAAIHCGDKPI